MTLQDSADLRCRDQHVDLCDRGCVIVGVRLFSAIDSMPNVEAGMWPIGLLWVASASRTTP